MLEQSFFNGDVLQKFMLIALFCAETHLRFNEAVESIVMIDSEWRVVVNPDITWINNNYNNVTIVVSIFNNEILKGKILKKLNFNVHAAPVWYRGIGGAVFAILEGRKTHGVVAHVMDEKIDHGPIIDSSIFNIEGDTYEKVVTKAHDHSIKLMKSILIRYKITGGVFTHSCLRWAGGLKTKNDLFKALENTSSCFSDKIISHYSRNYRIKK